MEESTKLILITVITSLATVITGNGLWNFIIEKMRRNKISPQEAAEQELTGGKLSLNIAASLREDMERLRGDVVKERENCHDEIREMRAEYEKRIEELDRMYQERIENIKKNYEEKVETLTRTVKVLEAERNVLLKIQDAFAKAKESGLISD